jgi:DHA1 family bicyclomycin/chloramphenicol resistance-like MFS transporter
MYREKPPHPERSAERAVEGRTTPGARFAIALAAITMIGPLAIHFFLPVVPAIKTAFHVSEAMAELTFSVTLVTMAAATLVYGTLSDRFGRRPVLLSGLVLFLIGSALSAVAVSVSMLIAGRLVQAVGAGCSVTLTRAMARDAYGPDTLVKAIAYLTMAYTLGPMFSPPLGGLLLDHLGWRSVFWVALLIGAVITAMAYLVLAETRRGERRRAGGGVLGDYLTLFADLRFTALVLQSGLCSGTFFAIIAASPFLVEETLGRSATEYGLYFFVFPAGYCVGNLISSRFAGRVSIEAMVLVGAAINLLAAATQAGVILAGALSMLAIFGPGLFVTFAQGLALPNAQAGAMQVKPALSGTAAGMGVFVQMMLSALFAQIYGWVADGTPIPMIATAMVAATLSLVAGAIPLLLTRRVPRR